MRVEESLGLLVTSSSYVQYFSEQTSAGLSSQTIVVSGDVTEANITELLPFTNYKCYVTANTSVGEGLPSNTQTQRTVESGESNLDGLGEYARSC